LSPEVPGGIMGTMNPSLLSIAAEVLRRLDGSPFKASRFQLLAVHGDLCLLRGPEGLAEVPWADLPSALDLSPLLDHTLLKAEARQEDIDQLCEEALEFGVASVCVNPLWVARCAARLQGSAVRTCTVVGFPLGATASHMKVTEAREAFREGAQEIDAVLSVGLARMGDWEGVGRELGQLRRAVPDAVLKLILETCLLTDPEKTRVCQVAVEEGVDFVKTSTGFSSGGATASDVALLRGAVGASAGVKASGGIRSYASALEMVRSGATRLGVSASRTILAFR